jgi:hypothetical protein
MGHGMQAVHVGGHWHVGMLHAACRMLHVAEWRVHSFIGVKRKERRSNRALTLDHKLPVLVRDVVVLLLPPVDVGPLEVLPVRILKETKAALDLEWG